MDTDAEFWRKRAEFYSDMCMNLIGEMGRGVKLDSIIIDENGITFTKRPGCEGVRSGGDTISRKLAIDLFPNDALEWDTNGGYIAPHLARRMIEELPPAQPEIIHCQDCIHWKSKEYMGNNDIHTLNLASLPCKNWSTAGDWFCGSAERREG